MTIIDYSVFIIYLVGIVMFGSFFVRSSGTTEHFTMAGRSLPGWAVGMSLLGTYVSSISFIALPGKAIAADWNPFVFSLSLPLAAWMGARFFVPLYRESGDVSAYSYLERRFGPWARIYADACYLLTQLARIGSIMFLVALTLNILLGWDIRLIIIGTGLLVTLYTFLGGIEAVIWTDVAQSIVLVGGAFVCAFYLLFNMPSGPSQLFAIAGEHGKFSLGSFSSALSQPTFWVVLLYGTAINLQNFGVDQNYIQRYHAARSSSEARRSVFMGALLYIPVSALLLFIGTALFSFYTARPESLPDALHAAASSDRIFPYFIVNELPSGASGLLIAAVFAAAMSTVDTSLNSASTIILSDIYKRFFRPGAGERESMRVLHLSTLAWGTLGTCMALAMIHVKSALDAWWSLSGIFSGGMLGLFLLGYFARRVRNISAALGTVTGLLVITWMTFSSRLSFLPPALISPFHSFMIPVVGTLAIFLVGHILGLFAKGTTTDVS